jgi:fructan beta-fructosidase
LKFELGDASKVGLAFGPEEVPYDVKTRRLNGVPLEPVDGKISLRVLVDRPMLEICGNAGRVYITRKRANPGPSAISKVKAFAVGGRAKLVQLEVHELESIWNRENER